VGSNHYDRLIRRIRLDGSGQLMAIHSGHGKIGDDQIEPVWLKHGQCVPAVVVCLHLMPVKLKQHLDSIRDGRFVIHHQNPKFCCIYCCHMNLKTAVEVQPVWVGEG